MADPLGINPDTRVVSPPSVGGGLSGSNVVGDGLADLREVLARQGRPMPEVSPVDLGTPGRTHVFLVDDIVLKCDDRIGSSSMIREASALELLDGSGLPVPRLLDSGVFDDKRRWVVIERMPGERTPDALIPAHELSPALGAQMGTVIARLHAVVEPPGFGAWALETERSLVDEDRARTAALVKMSEDESIVPRAEIERVAGLLAVTAGALEGFAGPVLAHRDVQPRNVLVDGDRITALLDFESSGGGDPAEDFRTIGLDWSAPGFAAFADAYFAGGGSLGPDGADRVVHHVLGWALIVFAYLGRIAPAYIPAARTAVDRALAGDRPPLPS